jgi:hypothetical protein
LLTVVLFMTKMRLAIATFMGMFLCGCAAERLRDNAVAVSATTTDIYYQMVLQNLARAYAQPSVLPWGIELSSGSVGVNDTEQVTGGYSENWPAVMPSAGILANRALQQSWTTAPITNESALLALQRYYGAVVTHALGHTPERPAFLIITSTPSVNTSTQLINYATTNNVPNPAVAVASPVGDNYVTNAAGVPKVFYTLGPQTNAAPAPPLPGKIQPVPPGTQGTVYSTVTQTTSSLAPPQPLGDIDISCFHFCSGVAPPGTISSMYGNTSAFVYERPVNKNGKVLYQDDMKNFTAFTLLILATIDQVPPKSPAGTTSIGPAPLPFF